MSEIRHPLSLGVSRILPTKLLRFVLGHSNDKDYVRNMFGVNFSYGNREILLKYAGLDYSNQIVGILEHGAPGFQTDYDFRTPRSLNGTLTKHWTWSQQTEEIAKSRGFTNVIAIGAPWYYLKRSLVKESLPNNSGLDRFLIMPSHSTGNAVDTATISAKKAKAKMFRDITGDAPATVCLHAVDFCDLETFRAYREVGFEVTCIGNSFQQPLWSNAGSRVRMMFNLHELMLNHTHYVSDGYGTSLHYAIDMGLTIGLFPEIKKLQILANSESGSREYFQELNEQEVKYLKKQVPTLVNKFSAGGEYLAFSKTMLGFNSVKEPDELSEILVYRPNIYPLNLGTEPW
jgi:hypothetical protein